MAALPGSGTATSATSLPVVSEFQPGSEFEVELT
jgi:hypothetical protein